MSARMSDQVFAHARACMDAAERQETEQRSTAAPVDLTKRRGAELAHALRATDAGGPPDAA